MLQLKLVGACFPLSDVTVHHCALCEGHMSFIVNEHYGVGPCSIAWTAYRDCTVACKDWADKILSLLFYSWVWDLRLFIIHHFNELLHQVFLGNVMAPSDDVSKKSLPMLEFLPWGIQQAAAQAVQAWI